MCMGRIGLNCASAKKRTDMLDVGVIHLDGLERELGYSFHLIFHHEVAKKCAYFGHIQDVQICIFSQCQNEIASECNFPSRFIADLHVIVDLAAALGARVHVVVTAHDLPVVPKLLRKAVAQRAYCNRPLFLEELPERGVKNLFVFSDRLLWMMITTFQPM